MRARLYLNRLSSGSIASTQAHQSRAWSGRCSSTRIGAPNASAPALSGCRSSSASTRSTATTQACLASAKLPIARSSSPGNPPLRKFSGRSAAAMRNLRAAPFGSILFRQRDLTELSQHELGNKAGLRQATVSKIESGSPTTRIQTICALLAALDLEP